MEGVQFSDSEGIGRGGLIQNARRGGDWLQLSDDGRALWRYLNIPDWDKAMKELTEWGVTTASGEPLESVKPEQKHPPGWATFCVPNPSWGMGNPQMESFIERDRNQRIIHFSVEDEDEWTMLGSKFRTRRDAIARVEDFYESRRSPYQ
jgi:hypothetical protein